MFRVHSLVGVVLKCLLITLTFVYGCSDIKAESNLLSNSFAIELRGAFTKYFISDNGKDHTIAEVAFVWYSDSEERWAVETQQPGMVLIETEKGPDLVPGPLQSAFSGFDGTDIFTLIRPTQPQSDGSPDVGIVAPKTSRSGGEAWAYPLWFAFLGGKAALGNVFHQVPPLQGGFQGIPEGYVYDVELERFPSDTNLISKATWMINEGYLDYSDLTAHPETRAPLTFSEANKLNESLKAVSQLSSWRKIDSTYEVKEFGELSGHYYPREFAVTVATYDKHAKAGSIGQRIVFSVTNAAMVSVRKEVLPKLERQTDVADMRFRTKGKGVARNEIRYRIEDRKWVTETNNARLVALLSARPPGIIHEPSDGPKYVRMLFVFLVAASVLIPIYIVWRKRSVDSRL